MADKTAPASESEGTAKPNETKAEKFTRIATGRTNKALNAIASLGGLASKANYDYTSEQWEKIYSALLAEMNKVKAKVDAGGTVTNDAGFSL